MYIHLGQDTVIRQKDIVGIFDPDTSTVAKRTRDTLSAMEKRGAVVVVSGELPKSFVLCQDSTTGEDRLCLSPVSVATLLRRLDEN